MGVISIDETADVEFNSITLPGQPYYQATSSIIQGPFAVQQSFPLVEQQGDPNFTTLSNRVIVNTAGTYQVNVRSFSNGNISTTAMTQSLLVSVTGQPLRLETMFYSPTTDSLSIQWTLSFLSTPAVIQPFIQNAPTDANYTAQIAEFTIYKLGSALRIPC